MTPELHALVEVEKERDHLQAELARASAYIAALEDSNRQLTIQRTRLHTLLLVIPTEVKLIREGMQPLREARDYPQMEGIRQIDGALARIDGLMTNSNGNGNHA